MRYIPTRGKAPSQSFKEALLEGLAPDGGLYVPESYPKIDLQSLRGRPYTTVAMKVLQHFVGDHIHWRTLKQIVEETYTSDTFGTDQITPIQWLEPGSLGLLKLSNGPTLAFKDVALQLLARLMEHVLAERGEELNILAATSGDTGSAAIHAFRGKKGVQVFMLSPDGRMSPFQRAQMYSVIDPRIHNIRVKGPFDACQTLVKTVSADAEFKAKYKLGAVNSINWARIAAQVVYYVYAYLQAARKIGDPVKFAVPSGNFGNALAAWVARQMGVPLNIVVATNENDVLYKFFKTGIYRVRRGSDVKMTSSPSMDIASASNFERFVFDLVRANEPDLVPKLWNDLASRGEFDGTFLLDRVSGIETGRATDAQVIDTIFETWERYDVIIDPHTAVALGVGLSYRRFGEPLIIAETAQPAKFADTIREAIGFTPSRPPGYEGLEDLPTRTILIDPDPERVKEIIRSHA